MIPRAIWDMRCVVARRLAVPARQAAGCSTRTNFRPVRMSSSVIGRRHCCGMFRRSRSLGRTPSHLMSGVVRLLLS